MEAEEIAKNWIGTSKENPNYNLWLKELTEAIEKYADQQKKVSVTDEEIEKEAWNRYREVTGGSYHADRPYNRKCFKKGAKWIKNKYENK